MQRQSQAVSFLVAVAVCYSMQDVQNALCRGMCQMSGHPLGGFWEIDQCVCKTPMPADTVRFPVMPRKGIEHKHPPGWSGPLPRTETPDQRPE